MSSLRNIKRHVQAVRQNKGILDTDQIQLETVSTPGDSNLSAGRMYTDGSTIYGYNGSSFVDMMTTGTINIAAWETLYAADTTLNMAGAGLLFAGTHASNNTFTLSASGTGDCLAITNTGSGFDISGTSDEWSIKSSGNLGVLELGTAGTINVTDGDLKLSVAGSTVTVEGILVVDETVTLTGAVTATASLTITGSADTTVLTVTAGDVVVTAGLLSLDDDDVGTGNLVIPSSVSTTGNPISVTADDLTQGSALYVDSSGEANFSNDGGYLNLTLSGTSVFKVQRYGATVIAGNNGTGVLTLTAGDFTVTQGSITITADDDNAATLTVTNDTATTASPFVFAGSGTFTGSTTTSFLTLTPSGMTTGTAMYLPVVAMTQGKALHIVSNAITTGNTIHATSTSTAMTSGEMLTISHSSSGNLATISGNVVSFTSSLIETAGTVTSDYDLALFSRTDRQNFAAQYDAQGSVVKIDKTQNKAAGTIIDAVIALEIVSTASGSALILGDSVKITSVGVNERSLNIVNAATGKDAVLITQSGVLTNGLAGMHIKTTGDLATGGANLILTASGSSVDAASRAFEIDAQKDMYAVYIDTDGITNDALYITHSGNLASGKAVLHVTDAGAPAGDDRYVLHAAYTGAASQESVVIFADGGGKDVTGIYVDCDPVYAAANLSAQMTLYSNAAGDLPILVQLYHEDAGAVSGEYCAKINFFGSDDAPAKELYASIEVEMDDTGAANPDGILWIRGDLAGTLTNSAGFTGNKILMGAAASTLTTAGAWDLTLSTNDGSSSSTMVITDGADGDISLAINGTGSLNLQNVTFETNAGSQVTGTATLTWGDAEGQVVFCTSAGGAYSITLPAVGVVGAGGWYTFIKNDADANAITIDGAGSETINGATTYAAIDADYDTVTIMCDGNEWFIVSEELA